MALDPMERQEQMESYVKTAILENEFEAQLLDSILTDRDIPHCLISYHDTAYNGLYQTQLGWGYLTAPPPYKNEIEEILADLRAKAGCVDDLAIGQDCNRD
jgi:hypothetical protein